MVQKKCTICDRRFNKTEHFKRHERSHTNERPYECKICHKRFSRSDVLSRHVKSHNNKTANLTKKAKDSRGSVEQDQNRDPPIVDAASETLIAPSDTQGLLSRMNADNNSIQATTILPPAMPPPMDVSSSSLGFLADVSAHHARSETDINPMMMNDQQAYFGWKRGLADQSSHRGTVFDSPNEMLRLWLEPGGDVYSSNASIDTMESPTLGHTGEHLEVPPDQQHRLSVDSTKSGNISSERFSKVQRYWLVPSNSSRRLMNNLWRDVTCNDLDNIFAVHPLLSPNGQTVSLEESHYGLDEECKNRLQVAFGRPHVVSPHLQTTDSDPATLLNFPPAEILEMALDLYFRNFHPLMPFVHLPTFSAKRTRLPLLYAMCLIGMVMMGTKGTTNFVCENFQFVLEKMTETMASCSVGSESPLSTLSTLAAAFLFVNLAAMTGEMEHFEKGQLLYVTLISIAQRHGLFAVTEGQVLDTSLFETVRDPERRWKAWSRVESTKRLIMGLLHLDSCYSSFLSTSPIVVPDSIQLVLPCDEDLFRANSSVQWMHLLKSGKNIVMPTIMTPSENVKVPKPEGPADDLCVEGLLSMVHARLSEAHHRLLSGHSSNQFAPCQTYAMDGRARSLPSLLAQTANNYSDSAQHLSPNTLILWHSMCMRLTADIQIFDLAAGRAGSGPARQALNDIAVWSQTPAARRACLHAAHIYKVMTMRKTSDQSSFHSVHSLFSAALVLGLYIFMTPDSAESQAGLSGIELLDNFDWQRVGTEGFTSFMEPQESLSLTPADNAATNFIRNGGTVYFRGLAVHGGYLPARRILLDYAGLLKDAGPWTVRKFSYVLHIMSDVLMDME
ncbi:hypothetical protein PHISCL_02521 [Aspergillus sclerotialis]|uniref:C2H2-type domain-containing protein n=1 Tax=Aspergillus sclerotialis TaxID=2070753 RepID=A0A3A3A547_9EURO|nr:hypothetical protein PHISCL_02521 [Aspergillus sclerotialis]